ncbi:hypothetical protein SAMN05216464_10621 [Mucilaginibacter pineti]|uniref:Uncharacterized protein n=1 Tax=Mucilaginibacter pineti TaxID=1391627 RepID=A0A1G7CQ79_9SPHI|nr:hypothetical protein SAMN05216464_10621 [Mucilaginibacter pineti]
MKPQIRFETDKSMLELSKAFDIPYSKTMQD